MTSGTFGPPRTGSSPSASLSASLASRLQTKVQTLGSTLYKLTWKQWTTPSGVSRLRLRASVRRTLVTALSGWPTPLASDARGSAGVGKMELPNVAALTGWATPCAMEPNQSAETVIARKERLTASTGIFRGPALPLGTQAQLAGWPTPTARDWRSDRGKQTDAELYGSKGRPLPRVAYETAWPNDRLPQVIAIRGQLTASGTMLTGYSAEIPEVRAGGPLTLEHSLWLQGIPLVWAECVSAATQSMPKSPRRSSKPRSA